LVSAEPKGGAWYERGLRTLPVRRPRRDKRYRRAGALEARHRFAGCGHRQDEPSCRPLGDRSPADKHFLRFDDPELLPGV